MGSVALTMPGNLSVVTVGEDGSAPWAGLMQWPGIEHVHIPFRVRNAADRNLFGVQMDGAVTRAERAVLLLAQGAGCHGAAWWARLSPSDYVSRVAGALFFQPEDNAGNRDAMFASPRTTLPFPSMVLDDAETARLDLAVTARGWGSRMVADSWCANGPLRRSRRMIQRFTSAIVAHDTQVAESLIAHNDGGVRIPR